MTTGNLFGPISKDYCLYFYLLSVAGLFLFAVTLFAAVYIGMSKGKGTEYFITAIAASLAYFLAYLQNRLLYNMCTKTL